MPYLSQDHWAKGIKRTNEPPMRKTFEVNAIVKGEMGHQGQTGLAGEPGQNGMSGEQGGIGAQGSQGTQGDGGPQGNQGVQGSQGNTGPAGDAGPQGSTGAQGGDGAQGATGSQGADGAQGAQGPAGAQGAAGPQGADGAAGPQGADGAAGPQGPKGGDSIITNQFGTRSVGIVEGTEGQWIDVVPADAKLAPWFSECLATEVRFRSVCGGFDLVVGTPKHCEGWRMPEKSPVVAKRVMDMWHHLREGTLVDHIQSR